jgi:hypothetical protein
VVSDGRLAATAIEELWRGNRRSRTPPDACAFDFEPIAATLGSVRCIAPLGHRTLQAQSTGVVEQFGALPGVILRVPDARIDRVRPALF